MSKNTITTEILSWIKSIGIAFALALLINLFIFEMTGVYGPSMNPTLKHGERLFAVKINQVFKQVPKHGSIVIVDANITREDIDGRN